MTENLDDLVETIRTCIVVDPLYYYQHDDFGDEGPTSSYGAVKTLLAKIDQLEVDIKQGQEYAFLLSQQIADGV